MEQKIDNKKTTPTAKKVDSTSVRFDKAFMKKVQRFVDKANRKQFGKKVRVNNFFVNLLNLADESLIEKVIKKSQDESLRLDDRKDINFKNNLSKFGGSRQKYEEKLMELMDKFVAENPV